MKKFIYILFCLYIILPLKNLKADDIEFNVSAPTVVAVGEQFRLKFTLSAEGTDFKAPLLNNFSILAGPSVSSSSNIQIINGKVTSSYDYTYTYILVAKKEGRFIIPEARIKVENKVYKTKKTTIEVVKGELPQNNSRNNRKKNKVQSLKVGDEDLFVKVNLNKTNVNRGEHIVAAIKVYTLKNLVGFEDIKYPSFSGFWTKDIPSSEQISLKRENINGKIYNVGTLKKIVLYPQSSGEITIEPFELECVIRVRTGKTSFWGPSFKEIKKKVKSRSRVVKVKELPENPPLSFNGAVGEFKMKGSLNKNKVKANDAINLKIKISGNGNLNLIDNLDVKFPSDFEVFDPKITNEQKARSNGVSGSKTFDYLIIPRYPGDFKIQSVKFSYFSTKEKKYKTLKTKDFEIKVEREDGDTTSIVYNPTTSNQEEIKFIGEDIRFIKTGDFNMKKKGELFYGSLNFYLSYIIPFILFFIFFIIRRKQIKENSNILLVKYRKANKRFKKRIKKASTYMESKEENKFYDEISKAMWGYLGDKLSISVAELSRDNAIETLQKNKLDNKIIDEFIKTLDNCQKLIFSPSKDDSKMEKMYKDAIEIINKLEGNLK